MLLKQEGKTLAFVKIDWDKWVDEDEQDEYDRVDHYLHSSSRPKLIEKVQNELLVNYSSRLLEKVHSGCGTLHRDVKVDDLTRMYKLFSKIPKGLDHVANMFEQHVTAKGMTLVQQADDDASGKLQLIWTLVTSIFVT